MIKEGVFLGKRYEILGRIGSGGMADVYRGKDHKLNRFVAIKVLKSDYRSDATFIQKFLSEAQSAAGLMHPNVVNVYDVGQDRGLYYMVMELVEGITLKDYIEKKGKLSPKETISITIQMVTGIQAAHNCNIIHRDIKPQNIIISKEGKVKVTDFGIARATTSTKTISTNVMGSVHYTSPEQARGGVVDEKSDLYSAGITMYEMITGHVPFDGDTTVTVALKHLQEEIVPPSKEVPGIPYSLECIILKCTQKNPAARYANCEALLKDLKHSLVDPDGDFVTMVNPPRSDRTVVMTAEELERVQRRRYGDDYEDDSDYDSDYEDEDDDDEEYRRPRERSRSHNAEDVNPDTKKIMRILMIVAGVVVALLVLFLVGSAFGMFGRGGLGNQQEKNTIEVPDVRGMTLDQATELLNKKGLGIKAEGEPQPSNEYKEGEIMSQDPSPLDMVEKNTTIHVVLSSGEEAKMTRVPKVIKLPEAEAEAAITQAKLIVKQGEPQYSSEYEQGTVISVSPNEGAEVEEGTEITIIVSLGVERVPVPDLLGKKASDAEKMLKDAGLKGKATEEYNDAEAGTVVSQETDKGKEVAKGSTIVYAVSKGPALKVVTVPDLMSKDKNTAEKLLKQAGLTPEYIGEDYNSKPAGQVFFQSVSPGTQVEAGTTVQFMISIGPEPTDQPVTE